MRGPAGAPIALGVAAVLLTACGGGSGVPSSAVQPASTSGPAGALLTQPPAGFQLTLDSSLNLSQASIATPAAQAATATALRGAGFSGGQERVWTKSDEHVTDLVLELGTDVDAAAFVQFEREQISASPAAAVSADAAIPASFAFTLYGVTRQGSHQTFCQGVWFPAGSRAFELTDCAGSPRYPNLVQGLAEQQAARADAGG
jgi:hypothetical protein